MMLNAPPLYGPLTLTKGPTIEYSIVNPGTPNKGCEIVALTGNDSTSVPSGGLIVGGSKMSAGSQLPETTSLGLNPVLNALAFKTMSVPVISMSSPSYTIPFVAE